MQHFKLIAIGVLVFLMSLTVPADSRLNMKFDEKPDCGVNSYDDAAPAFRNSGPVASMGYFGPLSAAPHIDWNALMPPLTGAALKQLQTDAETDAKKAADDEMKVIAAYKCPIGANGKACKLDRFSKGLIGDPYTVRRAALVIELPLDHRFTIQGVRYVNRLMILHWRQEAAQKFHVEFSCDPQE